MTIHRFGTAVMLLLLAGVPAAAQEQSAAWQVNILKATLTASLNSTLGAVPKFVADSKRGSSIVWIETKFETDFKSSRGLIVWIELRVPAEAASLPIRQITVTDDSGGIHQVAGMDCEVATTQDPTFVWFAWPGLKVHVLGNEQPLFATPTLKVHELGDKEPRSKDRGVWGWMLFPNPDGSRTQVGHPFCAWEGKHKKGLVLVRGSRSSRELHFEQFARQRGSIKPALFFVVPQHASSFMLAVGEGPALSVPLAPSH